MVKMSLVITGVGLSKLLLLSLLRVFHGNNFQLLHGERSSILHLPLQHRNNTVNNALIGSVLK